MIAVLLVVVLAYVLAQTVWLLWYGPSEPVPANTRTRLEVSSSGDAPTLSQAQIDNWQLFGNYEPVASTGDDKPTDAPDTRLRLELLGVFQNADTKRATAIIAEKGKEGELYHIGAIIGQLGLEPVTEGGSAGYRLGKRAPKQLLAQVGLQSDDVILSVNGHPLGTESNDMAALRSYQDTQQASIVVQRGDQQFTVNYPP